MKFSHYGNREYQAMMEENAKEERRKAFWGCVGYALLLFGFLALIIIFVSWWRWAAGCEFPADTLASEIPARCLSFY